MTHLIIMQWAMPIAAAAVIAGYILRWLFPNTIAATIGFWLGLAMLAIVYLALMAALASRLPEFFAYSIWWGLLGILGMAGLLIPIAAALFTKPATAPENATNKSL